jgi:hypothetical protein
MPGRAGRALKAWHAQRDVFKGDRPALELLWIAIAARGARCMLETAAIRTLPSPGSPLFQESRSRQAKKNGHGWELSQNWHKIGAKLAQNRYKRLKLLIFYPFAGPGSPWPRDFGILTETETSYGRPPVLFPPFTERHSKTDASFSSNGLFRVDTRATLQVILAKKPVISVVCDVFGRFLTFFGKIYGDWTEGFGEKCLTMFHHVSKN